MSAGNRTTQTDQIESHEERIDELYRMLAVTNSALDSLTKRIDENTASLHEFIELGKHIKFSISLLGYLERIAVFIAKIAAACAILWMGWRFAVKEALGKLS